MGNKIKFNDRVYSKSKEELDKKYEKELEEFRERLNKKSEKEFRKFEKKLEQIECNFISAEYSANKFRYDLNNVYKSILKCKNIENTKNIISVVITTISSYVKSNRGVICETACKTLAKIAMNINQ